MINDANIIPIGRVPTYTRAIKIGNRVFPLAVYTGTSGGGGEFYKCAAVDTSAKTWSGYKAVLTDGVYIFEDTVTEGLKYTENFPLPAQAYTSDLGVTVKELQSKDISDISGGEVIGERYVVTDAKTLATGYFEYRKLNSGWSLMWHVITHGSDRDYYHIIAVGLSADAVRMDASGYRYDPVEFTVDGDSRNWYYCRSQGVGANDGFNPIFNGEPIDVGSNGEDYLAQAKELLNNYLAGTIIGESPETGDKTYAYTVTTTSTEYADAAGDYYEISGAELDALYPQDNYPLANGSGPYYTNGGPYYLAYDKDTRTCFLKRYFALPEYTGWETVSTTWADGVDLPATGEWTEGFDVVAHSGGGGGGTPVFKVTGDEVNPEVNGDYYEVTPDNVNSCWDTSKKIYSNGTIYFAFTSNWWNGWTVVRDISITPFDDQEVTTSLAYSMGGHPNPWDVTDYNGDYFEITKY